MSLTNEQQAAVDRFGEFMFSPSKTMFALLGWAGCGKSYTASHMFNMMNDNKSAWDEMLWLAPTWKATHVSGKFLAAQGADFETRHDPFKHVTGKLILTTTQQALGIAPTIDENQSEDKVKFSKIFKGTMETLKPKYIVIDEVSMLSRKNLMLINKLASDYGTKVLIIGDPGQLPPVGQDEIKWSGIKNRVELKTIMRQSGESMIPMIAERIRNGKDWRHIKGAGLERVLRPAHEFLDNVGEPSGVEDERDVFIAYRNSTVNQVQEAACHKVYGHGRDVIQVGQMVLAQSAISQMIQDDRGLWNEERICNQDELLVTDISGAGAWGQQVEVMTSDGNSFNVEYVTQENLSNPNHPYRLELAKRAENARGLQNTYKIDKTVDPERRAAWKSFFELKDNTVLSFSHPFAITAHKSQGSSYRRAYVDSLDIEKFSPRALYVAATRPKETLVI